MQTVKTNADLLHETYNGPTIEEQRAQEQAQLKFWTRMTYAVLLAGLGAVIWIAFSSHLVMSF